MDFIDNYNSENIMRGEPEFANALERHDYYEKQQKLEWERLEQLNANCEPRKIISHEEWYSEELEEWMEYIVYEDEKGE